MCIYFRPTPKLKNWEKKKEMSENELNAVDAA